MLSLLINWLEYLLFVLEERFVLYFTEYLRILWKHVIYQKVLVEGVTLDLLHRYVNELTSFIVYYIVIADQLGC